MFILIRNGAFAVNVNHVSRIQINDQSLFLHMQDGERVLVDGPDVETVKTILSGQSKFFVESVKNMSQARTQS
jgi:hypothetical protein